MRFLVVSFLLLWFFSGFSQNEGSDSLIVNVVNWELGVSSVNNFMGAYDGKQVIATELHDWRKSDTLYTFDYFVPRGDIERFHFHYKLELDSGDVAYLLTKSNSFNKYDWTAVTNERFDFYADHTDTLFFQNTSKWKEFSLWYPCLAVRPYEEKRGESNSYRSLRFVYKSSKAKNNKKGWIIDNIRHREYAWCTGVKDEQTNQLFKIYPIPADDLLYVEGELEVNKLELYNQLGVMQEVSESSELSLKNTNSGVYILKIYTSEGVHTQKIIKQ